MQREITSRIKRHLDEQLGLWTRLLPWRREMATHIEEAYETARGVEAATDSSVDEVLWRKALADFGDVQDVASQMRKEHWPQYAGLRCAAIIISALVVFILTDSLFFLSVPGLLFALAPALPFLILDTYRGSIRWERVRSVGTWAALCGALVAATVMLSNLNDPSNIGAGLGGSVLCALYGVLFYTPRRRFVLAFIGIIMFDMCILIASFDTGLSFEGLLYGSWDSINSPIILRTLAFCCAGLTAGIARFGLHGMGKHALSIGTGTFLISLIDMLTKLDSPNVLGSWLLIAFGALLLATAASQSICIASRAFRRKLT